MAKNKNNIIAGSGTIYLADTTSALPVVTDTDLGTISFSGWSTVGYTEGVTIAIENEFQEITVDGELSVIKMIPIVESAEITVNLSERDLSALSKGLSCSTLLNSPADSSSVASDELYFGGKLTVSEKSLIFHGKSPEGYYRLWYFPIVVASGGITYDANNEHAPIEITFKALSNTVLDAGAKLFHVYDMTAPST